MEDLCLGSALATAFQCVAAARDLAPWRDLAARTPLRVEVVVCPRGM